MKLSVIIISYNTSELTLAALESLTKDLSEARLEGDSELIVVDNASSDDSVAVISGFLAGSPLKNKLIKNKDNLGFARANNQAIEVTSGELVWLLNSDTIVEPGTSAKMLEAFRDHPIDNTTSSLSSYQGKLDRLGILATALKNPDGSTQAQGGDLPSLLSLLTHLFFIDDLPLIGKLLPSTQHTGLRAQRLRFGIVQKGWVAGTSMMVRRELIDEIGNLDDNLFMYGEDIEWCQRARHRLFDVAINTEASVIHYGSASSGSARALVGEFKAYQYIFAKHKPAWQRPLVKFMLRAAASLRRFIFGTILGKKEKAKAYREICKTL